MKSLLMLSASIWLCTSMCAQKKIYEHPNVEELTQLHEEIAILPFEGNIIIDLFPLEKSTPEEIDDYKRGQTTRIQNAIYGWLLKKKEKGLLNVVGSRSSSHQDHVKRG